MTDHGPEANGLIPSELARQDASFDDLVEDFLGRLPQQIEQLDRALADDDLGALLRAAHQLKGSGGGYGYPALTELAAQVERYALHAQLDACVNGVTEIKQLVSRMVVRTD